MVTQLASYCKTRNVSVPFVSRAKQNREIKGCKYQLQAKIGRNYYTISSCMVLIRQNKGAKVILRVKSPTFRAANLKGSTVSWVEFGWAMWPWPYTDHCLPVCCVEDSDVAFCSIECHDCYPLPASSLLCILLQFITQPENHVVPSADVIFKSHLLISRVTNQWSCDA